MSERTYDSECIALEHLEEALRMYLDEKAYFAAITLAGAAEEILGKLAKHQGKENSIESLKKAARQIHERVYGETIEPAAIADRANYARNKLKHVNPGLEPLVTINVEEEAYDMLNRAIDNYWLVMEQLSPAMERFQREERRA
jgi:hypothetical protein